MKSAYELAMERLQKASPSLALNEDQKKQLAEIDSVYRAKIAEKELFLKNQIRSAQSQRDSLRVTVNRLTQINLTLDDAQRTFA